MDMCFAGNRYLVCEVDAGIMAYGIRVWDFLSMTWSNERTDLHGSYVLLGFHPIHPIVALQYKDDVIITYNIISLNEEQFIIKMMWGQLPLIPWTALGICGLAIYFD